MKVSGVVTLVLFLLLGCMAVPLPVHARQDGEPLPVRLRKDFGFNAGVRIQGRFTMLVQGDNQYSFVEFYIDGNLVHTDQEAPFEYSFHTDELGLGTHTFEAAAYTGTGERIASGMIAREIVTAQEGWEVAARIAVPVIGISLLLTLIGTAGPLLLVRDRKRFELGMYGLAGGTVCRSCSLRKSGTVPTMMRARLWRSRERTRSGGRSRIRVLWTRAAQSFFRCGPPV